LLLGYGFQARACIYVYLLGLVVLPIAGEVQKVTSSNHLSENLFFELKGTGTRIKHNERKQESLYGRGFSHSKSNNKAYLFKHKCMLYKLILCFNVQRFTNQANYDFYSTCLRNPFLENRAELSVSHPTCVPIKEAQLERSMTYLLVLKRSYVHSFVLKLDMHKDNVHLKSYNK
jgi:hypothetical protein